MMLKLVDSGHPLLLKELEDFDFSKNISGGCVMSDESPSIGCSKCDWRGIRDWYTGEMKEVIEFDSN